MSVAIEVVVAVVVVLAAAGAVLRRRKVRRDDQHPRPAGTLLTPPPSPYESAKGFRLIDGSTPEARHEPSPPRLEPTRHYVFSDPTLGTEEVGVGPHRHDVQWALERSAHRSPLSRRRRWVALVVIVALILAAGVLLHFRHAWFGRGSNSGASNPPATAPFVAGGPGGPPPPARAGAQVG